MHSSPHKLKNFLSLFVFLAILSITFTFSLLTVSASSIDCRGTYYCDNSNGLSCYAPSSGIHGDCGTQTAVCYDVPGEECCSGFVGELYRCLPPPYSAPEYSGPEYSSPEGGPYSAPEYSGSESSSVNLNLTAASICTGAVLPGAQITANGDTKTGGGDGTATFSVPPNTTIPWSATKGGYSPASGSTPSGSGATATIAMTPTGGCVGPYSSPEYSAPEYSAPEYSAPEYSAPEVAFNYSLSNSGNTSILKSGSVSYGINTITETLLAGITQPVILSADGDGIPFPLNVSYSIAPLSSCSPTCGSTITFSVGAAAIVGTYPIKVTGSPLGKTTNFNLIISAPAGGLSVSCAASPTAPRTNQLVTWTANVTNGSGIYTYAWTGSPGFNAATASSNPANGTYLAAGTWSAAVTVTDTPNGTSANCSASVNVGASPRFFEI